MLYEIPVIFTISEFNQEEAELAMREFILRAKMDLGANYGVESANIDYPNVTRLN